MSAYEVLLFLHITAVIVWLGAAMTNDLLWRRAERTREPAEMAKMGVLQEWLTPRVFVPSSLATLLFGALLVAESETWGFGDLWIALGLLGFAGSFFVGLLYLRPQGNKMGELIRRHGPTSLEARRHAKKLLTVARVQLLVLFLVVAVMVLKPSTSVFSPAAAGPGSASASPCLSAPQRRGAMRAAHYFGSAWPQNFWNSSLEGLDRDLARMRDDGFDTVVLVVPWREFQPSIAPAAYNEFAFRRLDRIFRAACRARLGVALRVSYNWDFYRSRSMAVRARVEAVHADEAVYRDWLAYVGRVAATARRHANFRLAFLSWEDFWLPVVLRAAELAAAGLHAERVELARTIGFQRWLAERHTLKELSALYGEPLASWAEVPTPKRTSPAFRLLFTFHDEALLQRFFAPARARFPRLSLEVRVDDDPVFDGRKFITWHDHSTTFALPDTDVAVGYWSPAMGAPNEGGDETAEKVLARLEWVLDGLKDEVGGRRVFIDQFNYFENNPYYARSTAIASDQVDDFLVSAAPILARYTDGYGLWAYRDYRADATFNSSFSLGAAGWALEPGSSIVPRGAGRALLLEPGGAAMQRIPKTRDPLAGISKQVRVTLRAWPRGAGALLRVRIGGVPERSLRVVRGRTTYGFTAPTAELPSYTLEFSAAGAPVEVDDVRVFSFVQKGRIRTYDGRAGDLLPAIRELNRRLAGVDAP